MASCLSLAPQARAQGVADIRFEVLAESEKAIIDRIAADFYEDDLSPVQAQAIEDHTSEIYSEAAPEQRPLMRAERRAQWRAMGERERAALMDAKRPLYGNLTEGQKAPFRAHAINRLKAAGAIDETALEEALQSDL